MAFVEQGNAPSGSLFSGDASQTPAALAGALAPPVIPGHFDELRGAGAPDSLTPQWARFFEHLGREGFRDLDRLVRNLQRQVRDNGITYNIYADREDPQRPWSLDLFPLLVTPQSWRQIEAGVLQRVDLLERIMGDVYGAQRLLAANLLPPALVHGHPGYLRPLHGVQPAGGRHLHIVAFDLARDADANWWVVAQRTQAPSGLGYLLENRIIVSRMFPQAFRELRVQRVAASYRALAASLRAMSPAGADARIVLLTPGPYNETYFEHAYLARYLGLTLVEGGDLTVRDERVYLKTLQGLEPVHGILKRLDDEFLDPLELRADSRLGVPGLLQAMRAGNVLVANAPGSGFLESSALLGFLPALSERLLGEPLKLPSLATWWCGERAAMEAVLPRLSSSVIKSTYGPAAAVLGKDCSRRALDEMAGRIVRQGDAHTVQAYLPLSQMPTWKAGQHDRQEAGGRMHMRSLLLRVFVVSDGAQGWRVLPGGLTRIAAADEDIASMQRGGSSADTWVMTEGEVDHSTLLGAGAVPADGAQRTRSVSSRAAENLFWLGRYTERAENSARLARQILLGLNGEDPAAPPFLHWMGELAVRHGLVLGEVPAPAKARRMFERSLLAALGDAQDAASVAFNLAALRRAASGVRERLSQEQWHLILDAERAFVDACAAAAAVGEQAPLEALRGLEALLRNLAAMTGAQTDRMTRDDGWRLLSSGRHLERLDFLASAMALAFETGAVLDEGGFESLVALFDSTITFHARYQQRRDIAPLLDLLVLDRDNPRSLGWVVQTLKGRLLRLAEGTGGEFSGILATLPDPQTWSLAVIAERDEDGRHGRLLELLRQCSHAAWRLSDQLGARYFTHSGDARQSLGA